MFLFLLFRVGFLSIGISTITRPSGENYLLNTIKLLIDNLGKDDASEVYVVVFLADFDDSLKSTLSKEISQLFKTYIDQELLLVINAPQEFYHFLTQLVEYSTGIV